MCVAHKILTPAWMYTQLVWYGIGVLHHDQTMLIPCTLRCMSHKLITWECLYTHSAWCDVGIHYDQAMMMSLTTKCVAHKIINSIWMQT